MLKRKTRSMQTSFSHRTNGHRLGKSGSTLRLEALELRCYLSAGATGTEFRVNTTLADFQGGSAYSLRLVASDPAGNFVVVWDSNIQATTERDVYMRRYSASGQPISPETLVSANSSDEQWISSIGMAEDGSYVISWEGSNSAGIMARRFNAAGVPFGDEFQVNTTRLDNDRPNVAVAPNGEFLITWTRKVLGSKGEVYGQRFAADGTRAGGEFRISNGNGDQSVAAIHRDGSFVVAWNYYQGSVVNDYEIHARRFNAAGEPLGEEFTVNVPKPGPQQGPSIAINEEGDFVIAWVGRDTNFALPSSYARAFSRDGLTLTDELQVGSAGNILGVKVVITSDDEFLVTWSGQALGAEYFDAYARMYKLTGEAGPSFRVNQSTAGHQTAPSAAVDAQGNVTFTWNDSGPLSTYSDIWARQFAAADLQPKVTGRRVFYNRSYYDGADPAANLTDDAAIAPDKQALLPGQTASFANYTSYNRGINGTMIDVLGLVGTPTVGDFTFRVGASSDVSGWTDAASPTISIRRGGGPSGADRISLVWPDGSILNRWLEITMLANERTGLEQPDVFYFGNAVGESGNSLTDARVSILDELLARNNPHNATPFPARLDNRFDYNRDCRVSVVDQLLARNNITTAATQLQLITPSAALTSGLAAQSLSTQSLANSREEIARGLALSSMETEETKFSARSRDSRFYIAQRRSLLGRG